ncbi:MAG: hypothetical protein M3R27_03340 [Bacteroidota bacterium]|nr:hypothetical protein [Bacteroidota bacterium]
MILNFRFLLSILLFSIHSYAQQVPAVEENISNLVTFGKDGEQSWGDDDFSQTFFFIIPKFQVGSVYIRVFDAETSGENDEKKMDYNTKTKYTIYGGKSCFTARDVRHNQPQGNYKSGNQLYSKTFGANEIYDGEWYTFGPLNPPEGELVNEYGGYIFKIIAEGISGDDGNLYRYFLSSSPTENKAVEGSNAFTFEYTFRLSDNQNNTAHLYPYVEENVFSVKISNFDFDNDGHVNIVSMTKKGELSKASGDNVWAETSHLIVEKEKKTTLDVQFIKNKKVPIRNNNVTLFVTNQDGQLLPIYTAPIGGIPHHNYKIQFKQKKKTSPY